MQPAAVIGEIEYDRCPMNWATDPVDLWIVELMAQGYRPRGRDRLHLSPRIVEGLDFLRRLKKGGSDAGR